MANTAALHAQTAVNVAAGIAVALVCLRWVNMRTRSKARDCVDVYSEINTKPSKGWLLVVTSKFRTLQDRDALLEHVSLIAAHSARSEAETIGFQVAVADNDPLKILVFERFKTKEAWADAHRSSAVYKTYKAWQATSGIQVETTGQSYDELGFGFLTESERRWQMTNGGSI